MSAAGGSDKAAASHSGFVSPESSVGGHSEHHYPSYTAAAAVPLTAAQHPFTSAYSQPVQQQQSPALAVPKPRAQLPDLDSSQPGPIEIDTSLLYTPQSGNSSADVSHSGVHIDGESSVNSRESHWHHQAYSQDVDEIQSAHMPSEGAEYVHMPSDRAGASSSGRQAHASQQEERQGRSQQRTTSAPRTRAGCKATVPR